MVEPCMLHKEQWDDECAKPDRQEDAFSEEDMLVEGEQQVGVAITARELTKHPASAMY